MGDLYIALAEEFYLFVGEPHRMHGQQVLIQHPQPFQMGYRRLAKYLLAIRHLFPCFRHMHMDAHPVAVGQFLGALDQPVGIVENGPQAEPNLHPALRGVVEPLQVGFLLIQFLLGGPLPDGGQAFAAIHHGLCQLGPQARLGHGLGHAADELPPRLRKGGNPAADLLQAAHKGGNIGILLGHIAFKGPHPVVEPGDKGHVVSNAPADLLGGMHVGVHKSRQDVFALEVYDLRVRAYQRRVNLAHRQDGIVLHQQAAAIVNLHIGAHGEDIAVFQICLRHACRPPGYISYRVRITGSATH